MKARRQRVPWRTFTRRSVAGEHPTPYGIACDYALHAMDASRWVRRVRVRSPRPGVVRVEVRGPARLPLPGPVRRRVSDRLRDRAPVNAWVEVR